MRAKKRLYTQSVLCTPSRINLAFGQCFVSVHVVFKPVFCTKNYLYFFCITRILIIFALNKNLIIMYKSPLLPNMGCLHPRLVYSKLGIPVRVPCRQCSACKVTSSLRLTFLNDLELKSCQYVLFTTLTYSNSNVPRVEVVKSSFDGRSSLVELYNIDDGCLVASSSLLPRHIKFLDFLCSSYHKKFPSYFNGSQIPFLQYADAQLLLKRLRERIRRKFGQSFRYILCGEYGPSTFRPHFHILFLCPSEEIRSFLSNITCECWKYGNCVSKYFAGSSSKYISSYLCGSSCDFPLYSHGSIKARCRHSSYLGRVSFLSDASFNKFIAGLPYFRDLETSSCSYSIPAPSSLENSIFPKCRGFNILDDRILFSRYCLSLGYYGKHSASEVARSLALEVLEYSERCSDNFLLPSFRVPFYCERFGFEVVGMSFDEIYKRIYNDVLISFHFITSSRLYSNSLSSHFWKLRNYYLSKSLHRDKNSTYLCNILADDNNKYDDLLSYFFPSIVEVDHLFRYLRTECFTNWSIYCDGLSHELSKSKKIKEPYSLLPYD